MMQNIAQLKAFGMHLIVVHGGGSEISKLSERMGLTPQFLDGLRITDNETIEIVQMVLIGKINKELVSHLNQKGAQAIGLSGQDCNLLVATKSKHPSGIDLGFVGQISQVNPKILKTLIESEYIPVVAPIATSQEALAYNINADSAASEIAISLGVDHLIFLSDVPGVLMNPKDASTTIDVIRSHEAKALIANGTLTGGMIPKVKGAIAALEEGVGEVHILDGRAVHSLCQHLQGEKQIGTTFKL
jgi:acetylglutamate kinase